MNDEELLNFLASNLEEAGFLPFTGLEAEKIMEIEADLGFDLPMVFRYFYLNFNGAKNEVEELFYPLNEVPKIIAELKLERGYFPFFKNALEQIFIINLENLGVFCLDEGELEFLADSFEAWLLTYWE